jgi:cell division protein FtsZ
MIPQENTLDWSTPDCSIDCKLDLYQLEWNNFPIDTK